MMKKVVFSFSDEALASTEDLRKIMEDVEGHDVSLASVVRESLRLLHNLVHEARNGYSEVILRNPQRDEEKEIIIPLLQEIDKENIKN